MGHEDEIRYDNPCIVGCIVSQIAAFIVPGMFVSELQMLVADNVTRHMSHDTRGKLVMRKNQGLTISQNYITLTIIKQTLVVINNLLWWLATSHELLWNYLKLCLAFSLVLRN